MIRFFENEFVRYEIIDEILYVLYKGPSIVSNIEIEKFYRWRVDFLMGETYPVLAKNKGVKFINKSGRDQLALQMLKEVEEVAVVTGSAFENFIYTLVFRLTKTSKEKYKIFSSEEEAKKWIKDNEKIKV